MDIRRRVFGDLSKQETAGFLFLVLVFLATISMTVVLEYRRVVSTTTCTAPCVPVRCSSSTARHLIAVPVIARSGTLNSEPSAAPHARVPHGVPSIPNDVRI